MADQYGLFWNSVNGDRLYDADAFSEWLRKFFTNGVFANELQVNASSGMGVTVGTGYVNINGKVRLFNTATSLKLATAGSTYPRIDTIVVECNYTDRKITLKAVTGAYSGDTPTATAPVRTAMAYQLVLAEIYVAAGATSITQSNITDKRTDTSVCGIVAGTVKGMDISQVVAQMESSFGIWFDRMKGQLTTDAAGKLQTEIDSTIKNVTLSASSWSSSTYTVTDSLITATSNQEIIPAVGITPAQLNALQRAVIIDSGQSVGSITLKALGEVPTIDIPVRVIFRGSK